MEICCYYNREALNDMCNLSPYTTMMKEAPCAILVLADLEKAINKEYGLINCAAAIENLIIEAMHQELGTCWCGIAPVEERIEKFKNILNWQIMNILLGWLLLVTAMKKSL